MKSGRFFNWLLVVFIVVVWLLLASAFERDISAHSNNQITHEYVRTIYVDESNRPIMYKIVDEEFSKVCYYGAGVLECERVVPK